MALHFLLELSLAQKSEKHEGHSDDLRQFRMTTEGILGKHGGSLGSHVHFETFDAAGRLIKNISFPIRWCHEEKFREN